MLKSLFTSVMLIAIFIVILGLGYPLAVYIIGQIAFPHQANGSLISENGRIIGSELIGQPFSNPGYFWGRPSSTLPFPYDPLHTSGSNLGPTNPKLLREIKARIYNLRKFDPDAPAKIPSDLVMGSGSGVDPYISLAAALYQVPRVAMARDLSEQTVEKLVKEYTKSRQFGFLGEPVVNVLELNIALDKFSKP